MLVTFPQHPALHLAQSENSGHQDEPSRAVWLLRWGRRRRRNCKRQIIIIINNNNNFFFLFPAKQSRLKFLLVGSGQGNCRGWGMRVCDALGIGDDSAPPHTCYPHLQTPHSAVFPERMWVYHSTFNLPGLGPGSNTVQQLRTSPNHPPHPRHMVKSVQA